MTAKLDEYHRWMQRYDAAARALIASPQTAMARIGQVFEARERALDALRPPDTVEERRVLVDSLLDYARMFNGNIEGPAADAARRLSAREEALATAEPLGADDPFRAQAAVMVATSLINQSRDPQRAATLMTEGIGVMERTPGASVPWLIKARENLGHALMQLGRWSEAAAILADVLRDWLARPAGTPPSEPTGSCPFNLGQAYEKLERRADARDAYRVAIERHRANGGPEDPGLVETQLRLGSVLAALGETREARELLAAVLDVVGRKAGAEHPFHVEARELLARLPS